MPASQTNRRAVLAFFLGTLFFAYAFIQRVSPSVMIDELMRDFAIAGTGLGTLSALYFYSYAAIQLPVGMLADRFGPRRLMALACLLCALASYGFASAESFSVAAILRSVIGISVAFAFVCTLSIASMAFSASRFALCAGLLQGVGMTGAILGQAPLSGLVKQIGWRDTMLWLALLALVLALLIYLIVPRRTQEQQQHDGNRQIYNGLKAVLRNKQSWLSALLGFGAASVMLTFAGLWGVPWLRSKFAIDITSAALLTSFVYLGWAVSGPILGWLSDHLGHRKPIMIASFILSLVAFGILIQVDQYHFFLLALLFTLCGCGGSAMTIAFSSIAEHNSPANKATALGFLNMFIVGAGAVMQPIFGWLLDHNWQGELNDGVRVYSAEAFTPALWVLLAVHGLALVCALLLRETHCQQQHLTP